MENLLNHLREQGRTLIIKDRDGKTPYLERGYLYKKSDGKENREKTAPNDFNVFIHRFLKSDDPIFHNHPWPFVTFVWSVGYWEHLPKLGRVWRPPGSVIFHEADDLHWVEIPEGQTPMTIFFHFEKRDESWGFLQDDKIINHKIFLERFRGIK